MDKKAFVFTGNAFLLVVPAVILVASLTNMLETGDVGTTTAVRGDVVFYTYAGVQKDFEEFCKTLVTLYGDDSESIRNMLRTSWVPAIEEESMLRFGANVSIDESKIAVLRNQSGGTNYMLIGNSENISRSIPINISDPEGNILLALPTLESPQKGLGPLAIGYADPCPSYDNTHIGSSCYQVAECPANKKYVNITVRVRNSEGDLVNADVNITANSTLVSPVLQSGTGFYYGEYKTCTKNTLINIIAGILKSSCSLSYFEKNETVIC